jgi:hypothetical protein
MPATEDLFTPIHKALRSMIYSLGGRLQSTDFSDRTASALVLADLEHEFANALSATCVLCLLHVHAGHEETAIFPSMQSIDPGLVRSLIDDHAEISRRLIEISAGAKELATVDAPTQRIEQGARINRQVNELFAFYLAHLNREEATLVPAMKEHFTDEQMRGMQARIIGSLPPERLAGFLRWLLPSLSTGELAQFLTGIKRGPAPQALEFIQGIGKANVDPGRWVEVRARVGF